MAGTRTLIVGGAVVCLAAAGWFVMSHFVMGTQTADAINEAFGVGFGLLVLLSAIGAVTSRRGNHP